MFSTPVLLITFNRPEHTKRVWAEIKKHHPREIYIFQDGERKGNTDDLIKCAKVRELFSEPLDWECQIKTFISGQNLGCGRGPVEAISWFFKNVDQGIIMEDDCLPHADFFGYCEKLLNKYNKNKQVMVVGATTYHDNYPCEKSYLFSRYFTGGAWASWKSAWLGFSIDLEALDETAFFRKVSGQFYSSAETNWWLRKVKEIKSDNTKKHYWDYQMQIHMLNNNGLAIRPHKNLISNIGFDSEGTHTHVNDNSGERKTERILPLSHPENVNVDKKNDYLHMAKEKPKKIEKRIIDALYRYMSESNGFANKVLLAYQRIKRK
ncbi:MAG: hypothetical protein ACI9WC_001627 [Arenicella sp.]|jgi:hypothetical protein